MATETTVLEQRQRAMGLLARAPAERLQALAEGLGDLPEGRLLRAPESGLVMLQGRMGGEGAPFNLGEMTVTRCAVALEEGTVGHAYVQGRDSGKATLAARLDAFWQLPDGRARVDEAVLRPLAEEEAARREHRARRTAATKVEFFTLVRGED